MRSENKHDRFVAFIDLQEKVPGKKPPCVHCGDDVGIIRFHHCQATGAECDAFRSYTNSGNYTKRRIGKKLRSCEELA